MDYENRAYTKPEDNTGYIRVPTVNGDGDTIAKASLIANAGDLSLKNVTIQNARLAQKNTKNANVYGAAISGKGNNTIIDSTIRHNASYNNGGAAYVSGGLTTVENSIIEGNVSGAGHMNSMQGGFIYITNGSLIIKDSEFRDNYAQNNGGVAYVLRSNIEITGSLFDHNMVGNDGSALNLYSTVAGKKLLISNCVFENNIGFAVTGQSMGTIWQQTWPNTADDPAVYRDLIFRNNTSRTGAAISDYSSSAESHYLLENIEISENNVGSGGVLYNQGGYYVIKNLYAHDNVGSNGQGIYNNGGSVILEDSRIVDNKGSSSGAGIYIIDGDVTVRNSEISGNQSDVRGGGIFVRGYYEGYNPSLTLENTVIKDNTAATTGGGIAVADSENVFSSVTIDDASKIYDNHAGTMGDDFSYVRENNSENQSGNTITLDNISISGIRGIDGWYHDNEGDRFKDTDNPTVFNDYVDNDGQVAFYLKAAGISNGDYDGNGGDTDALPITVKYGNTYIVDNDIPTREGYTFTGWNTKPDGSGTSLHAGDEYDGSDGWTLYAQWVPNPSKVIYNSNGGEGTMSDTEGVFDEEVAISDNSFTRSGYSFIGWNTAADGTGTSYNANSNYTLGVEYLVLYAQWSANPSKIIYEANGGSGTMDNTEGVVDQTVSVADNGFNRTGYSFVGWNTAADGTGTSYDANDNYTLGVEYLLLYAQWSANPSKVVYVANGGTGSMADTEGVVDELVIIANNGFERNGYTFTGWNTAANGSGTSYAEGADYVLTVDALNLYAQWTANASKIVYNANGGSGTMSDTEGVVDETVTVSSNEFTRNWYTFAGWNTKADGTGTSYAGGDNYTLLATPTIIYAQWQANPSKIMYDANGGNGAVADTEGLVDESVTVSDNGFERNGYTFAGWNTEADGSGTSYAEGADYVLTVDSLELYAQWQANPSRVVYNANGATGSMANTDGFVDETVVIEDNAFERDGYVFAGWNTEADGSGVSFAKDDEYILTAENLVLYAQWNKVVVPVPPATSDVDFVAITASCAAFMLGIFGVLRVVHRRRP